MERIGWRGPEKGNDMYLAGAIASPIASPQWTRCIAIVAALEVERILQKARERHVLVPTAPLSVSGSAQPPLHSEDTEAASTHVFVALATHPRPVRDVD